MLLAAIADPRILGLQLNLLVFLIHVIPLDVILPVRVLLPLLVSSSSVWETGLTVRSEGRLPFFILIPVRTTSLRMEWYLILAPFFPRSFL